LLRPEELEGHGHWAENAANRLDPSLVFPRRRRAVQEDRRRFQDLLRRSTDPKALEARFALGEGIKEIDDSSIFNLIDFSHFGGELTPLEKQRLTHLGFLGDAGKCLAKHLRATSKYFP